MALMTVYHGGYQAVENPEIKAKKYIEDFGPGFYCTIIKEQPHNYDIVIGAMADDQVYTYISDYIDGTLTREQFWALAKFKYPTHQIVFCSNEALKCLTYRGYEEVRS